MREEIGGIIDETVDFYGIFPDISRGSTQAKLAHIQRMNFSTQAKLEQSV